MSPGFRQFLPLVFLLVFFAPALRAQEPTFYHYTVNEGLPSTEIYDVIQDSKGFIWISTDRGVSRYDGYVFSNYTSQDGLTDNSVFNLKEDSLGRIWCITSNCRLCFFRNDSIVPYPHNDKIVSFLGHSDVFKSIRSLNILASGTLEIGFMGAGFLTIDAAGKVRQDTVRKKYQGKHNYEIRYTNKRLSMGSEYRQQFTAGVHAFFQIGESTGEFSLDADPHMLYFVGEGLRNGSVAFGSGSAVYLIQGSRITAKKEMQAPVIRIYEDRFNRLWVSARQKGVTCYDPAYSFADAPERNFLDGKTVSTVLCDNEGGIWMGTLEHGLYYQPSPDVRSYFTGENGSGGKITGICRDGSGRVLVMTYNAVLAVFRGDSLTGKQQIVNEKGERELNKNIFYDTLSDRLLLSMESSMYSVDGSDLSKIRRLEAGIGGSRALEFFPGHPGCYWSARQGMALLMKVDPEGGKMKMIKRCLTSSRLDALCYSRRYGLLIGSPDGLFTLVHDSMIRRFSDDPLLQSRISSIHELSDGTIALATIGRGLLLLKDGTVRQYTTADGLPSNIVNTMTVDESGDIWIGTNRGVSRIGRDVARRSFSVRNVTVANGLPTNEVYNLLSSGGFLWVGTSDGLCLVDMKMVNSTVLPPPVVLRKVLVNDAPVPTDSFFTLRYNQNMLDVSFTGLSYQSQRDILYRYRLIGSGSDTSWEFTRNTSVRFMSLSPGKYEFEVYARNSEGAWSSTPARFSFCITPPFWFRWWFVLTAVLFVLLFCGMIVFRRLQRIREKEMMKRRIVEFQQKALAAQMNPHFIFNSLNSIQAFVLGNDKESVMRFINRFSLLLRRSLDNSMEAYVPLRDDLEVLRAYLDLEGMRFRDHFTSELRIDPGLDTVKVCVPAMLIQPYAENAIRHGLLHKPTGGGKLTISLKMEEGNLVCTVDDNGVGRQEAARLRQQQKSHRPAGTSITGDRLELLCREAGKNYYFSVTDKTDEDGNPAGTTVTLYLPYMLR